MGIYYTTIVVTGFYSTDKAIENRLEPTEYKSDDNGIMVFGPRIHYEFPGSRSIINSEEKINNCFAMERITVIDVVGREYFDISEAEKNRLISLATECNVPITEIRTWIVEYMTTSLDNFQSLTITCRLPVN